MGAVGVGRGARRRLWRGGSHPIGFWDVGWPARAARRRGPRARVRAGALGAWRPRVRRRRLWPPCARASARRGGRAGRGGCALPARGGVAALSCGRCAGRRSAVIGGVGRPLPRGVVVARSPVHAKECRNGEFCRSYLAPSLTRSSLRSPACSRPALSRAPLLAATPPHLPPASASLLTGARRARRPLARAWRVRAATCR